MGLLKSCLYAVLTASLFSSSYAVDRLPDLTYKYMKTHFTYRPDDESKDPKKEGDRRPGANWFQSPTETFIRKSGDCEDFANFAKYSLRKNGYKAEVLGIWRRDITKEAHAVCVYIDKGYFRIIDGTDVMKRGKKYKSLFAIARDMYGDWGKIEIHEESADNAQKENYKTTMRIYNSVSKDEFKNTNFPIRLK